MKKVSCVDIELAIMREFNFRQNLIVPNITNICGLLSFETDMFVLTKIGFGYGFEIKVSKADLKKDFNKKHHLQISKLNNIKSVIERYYGKFKYFYYAVPIDLKSLALELIPEFCGLFVYYNRTHYEIVKQPKKLFDYKWSEKERYEVARLGAMRIYSLKQKISSLKTK